MELGKLLVFFGVILVVAGIVVMLLGRMNLPLGRLPGDFLYRGKNTPSYFSRDTKSPPAAAPEVGSSSRAASPQSLPPPESLQKTPAVCLTPWLRSSTRMWMCQIVLPQQILPIIIPVRRSHHAVNMLLRWLSRIGRKPRQIRRPLVVEFNQNHRTLHPVVER